MKLWERYSYCGKSIPFEETAPGAPVCSCDTPQAHRLITPHSRVHVAVNLHKPHFVSDDSFAVGQLSESCKDWRI